MKLKKLLLRKLIAILLLFLLVGGNLIPFQARIIQAQETTNTESSKSTDTATQESTEDNTIVEETQPHEDRNAIREAEIARREAEKEAENLKREAEREAERVARRGVGPTSTPIPTPTVAQTSGVSSTDSVANSDQEGNSTDEASEANQSVENNNSGSVDNNINTKANTGDNVVSGENPPEGSDEENKPIEESDPIPKCQAELTESADVAGEEDNLLYESSEVTTSDSLKTVESEDLPIDSETQDNDSVTVANSNCASIQNDQEVIAKTGENDASDNEGSVMGTGDSEANSNLINKGNENISGTNSDGTSTGTSSEDKDNLTVDNNNQIYVENEVNVESKSGGNTLNDNDGQAELSTGDIDMMVTLLNILNTNITGEDFTHLIVNIFGDLSGDVDLEDIAKNLGMSEGELVAIIQNDETARQDKLAKKKEEFRSKDADVQNNNEAVVKNNVNVSGVSGENELSGNEDRTKLLTGRIKILVALINFINTNYTGTQWYFAMINIFGSLDGDLVLPDPNGFLVDETGANSQVISTENGDIIKTNTEETTIENANTVNLENNIEVLGDSGSNQAYSNEDRVSQGSGNVDVTTQLMNWLNVNITGNNWVLLVVNVFGTWYGQIVGFPGNDPLSAPDSGTLMVAAGSNGEGPTITEGLNGDSTTTNDEKTSVSNTNSATVENNVKIEGISGQNSTNENEDPVSVSTGWVDISADLFNVINMNVTGKKWMLVMVNIFGDFFGDITFPGVKKDILVEFSAEGELVEELIPSIGITSTEDNKATDKQREEVVEIIDNEESTVKVQTLSNNASSKAQEEEKIDEIESYTIPVNSNLVYSNDPDNSNQETKILGVSVNASKTNAYILFLVAVVSYLIALRLLAFQKTK